MRKSCKTVFAERMNFAYCILRITTCDIIQTCHVFLSATVKTCRIAKLLQDDTSWDITLKNKAQEEEKILQCKNNNNLGLSYFQTNQNQTIFSWN